MSDREQSPGAGGNTEEQPKSEHLNIKVTDNNNEVFFKIKRTTALSKLMNAFCDRQGKTLASVRFLFDGARVQATDCPDSVSPHLSPSKKRETAKSPSPTHFSALLASAIIADTNPHFPQLDMQDGDTLEVHQEQIGGF